MVFLHDISRINMNFLYCLMQAEIALTCNQQQPFVVKGKLFFRSLGVTCQVRFIFTTPRVFINLLACNRKPFAKVVICDWLASFMVVCVLTSCFRCSLIAVNYNYLYSQLKIGKQKNSTFNVIDQFVCDKTKKKMFGD